MANRMSKRYSPDAKKCIDKINFDAEIRKEKIKERTIGEQEMHKKW